jgi:hypothetical protein
VDEIVETTLFLKLREGQMPKKIGVAFVTEPWTTAALPIEEARAKVDGSTLSVVTAMSQLEEEGYVWAQLDVTDFVKSWLRGDYRNYGFALFGVEGAELAVFEAEDSFLSVDVWPKKRPPVNYGKFGYTKQPKEGMEADKAGNCMSYALRDLDMILFDDLALDYDELNRIYFDGGGEAAVLKHAAGKVEAYVEAHKETLEITNFRRIDSYDSEIDPQTEYRIALRVFAYARPELPMQERGGFDYHFWMQIKDGRWAQKFPLSDSMIIPGTAFDVSPGKFPWDSSLETWGAEKFMDVFTGDVIYYAVTKGTDGFTAHKRAGE